MPSDRITLVWDDCEKFLQKSCNRSNGRATTKDIFYDCIRNVCSLWIIFDTETLNIIGCAITKISQYPTGKRMLNIDHVAGKKMNEWADRSLEVIYKWAKATFGNKAVPKWNFHKILIDKNGQVHNTFVSFTNPMSNKVLKEIEKIL